LPFDLFEFKIVDFMDTYFARARNPEEMQIWGRFLARFDFKGTFWKKSLSYLELGGDAKDLVDFVERLKLFNRTAYLEIKRQWKRELPELEKREDWNGLALRDFLLNGGRRLPELLRKMTVGAGNFVFFLLGEDPYFDAAVDWCTRNNRLPEAWEMCAKWKQYDRAALLCERAGHPERAAGFYVLARQPGKAASIYANLGKFDKAGDVFTSEESSQKRLRSTKCRSRLISEGWPGPTRKWRILPRRSISGRRRGIRGLPKGAGPGGKRAARGAFSTVDTGPYSSFIKAGIQSVFGVHNAAHFAPITGLSLYRED